MFVTVVRTNLIIETKIEKEAHLIYLAKKKKKSAHRLKLLKTQLGIVQKKKKKNAVKTFEKDQLILLFFVDFFFSLNFWSPFCHLWKLSLFCFPVNLRTWTAMPWPAEMNQTFFFLTLLSFPFCGFCLPKGFYKEHFISRLIRSLLCFLFFCL